MELKIEKTTEKMITTNYRQIALQIIGQVKIGQNTLIEFPFASKVQNAIAVWKNRNGIKNKMFKTKTEATGIRFYRID